MQIKNAYLTKSSCHQILKMNRSSIYCTCKTSPSKMNSCVTCGIRRSASGTPLCNRKMPTYSLPAFCWDFTSLVALSMHTIRQPVTFGSSVPLCPVFSTRRILFTHATTSCEDGFDGLSRFINPLLNTVTSTGSFPLIT